VSTGDYFLTCYRELLNKGLSEEEAMREVWGDIFPETEYDVGLDSRWN